MPTTRIDGWPVAGAPILAFHKSMKSLVSLPDEIMTPEQFFTPAHQTASAWPGERHLLLAVLEDAVASFLRHRASRTQRGKRLFREDEAWFLSSDQSWVFSFESICAHLHLDSAYIRHGLRQLPGEREEAVFPNALSHSTTCIDLRRSLGAY